MGVVDKCVLEGEIKLDINVPRADALELIELMIAEKWRVNHR
ncbi:phosphomethylpyrimidine kinase [Shewanella benthica KT99]|uniref:Phosphomethylpyrimidine kinase n=1 Tax=Shewanella benthica KT99 TaxID=314608 RepID=A9D2X9_9GAMM|nr:phosphomethylpyrimidine kinase [Shewanella benthica KT99]